MVDAPKHSSVPSLRRALVAGAVGEPRRTGWEKPSAVRSLRRVAGAKPYPPSTAGRARRAARLEVAVEHVGLRIGDRRADADPCRERGFGDRAAGGPNGGLGRPVDVPQARAACEQAPSQVGRQLLAADQQLELLGTSKAGREQQLVGRWCRLKQRDAAVDEGRVSASPLVATRDSRFRRGPLIREGTTLAPRGRKELSCQHAILRQDAGLAPHDHRK